MARVFQLVLLALVLLPRVRGDEALLATSAVVGLTDLDALTLSIARAPADAPVESAVDALTVGIIANTLLKASVALAIGRGPFRRIVPPVLVAVAAVIGWHL